MKVTGKKNERVANMIFADIYPIYLNRLVKNGKNYACRKEINTLLIKH